MINHKRTIKVFISYSQESEEHKKKALTLADRLCKEGIDCNIDQYIESESPRQGWPRWMEQQIRNSDYVLCICTETYDKRARGDEIAGKGKGVRFESLLTYQDIYDNDSLNEKFIPVIFSQRDTKFIPKPLKPFQCYQVNAEEGYKALYRKLTRQRRILKPKIGKIKKLPIGINLDKKPKYEASSMNATKHNTTADAGKMELEISINRDFGSFSVEEREKLLAAISELLEIDSNWRITRIRPGSVKISLKMKPKEAGKLLMAVKMGELKKYDVVDAELKKESNFDKESPIDTEWIASRRESVNYYLQKKWALEGVDLEEVTQQTMVAALYSSTNADKSVKRIRAFLLNIADNVAKTFFHKRGRHERRRSPIEISESLGIILEDEVEAEELARILREKLSMLPKKYLQVLELIFYQDYTEREAAEKLGIPVDRLYSLKSDALKRLRKLCKKDTRLNPR